MTTVTLLTRVGCHLCDDARAAVRTAAAATGAQVIETDVDTDPELQGEYGDLVPVVLIDGATFGYYRIDPAKLQLALNG